MDHLYFLNLAVGLAKKGYGFVSPNPMVGAVLVLNGKIIATGYHDCYGGNHAEVNLFKSVKGSNLQNAVLYLSMQPCCIYGKTPPCTDIILKYGIKSVIYASRDLNPLIETCSDKILTDKGVDVQYLPLKKAYFLNRKFFKYISSSKPYITLKIASTLDGYIADCNSRSKYITSGKSRLCVQKIRQGYDAILVGSKTYEIDKPSLNVRNFTVRSQPVKIVMSAKNGLSSYNDILDFALKNNISSILVEGGAAVFSYFLQNRLFDELLIFYSPKIFGNSSLSWSNEVDGFTLKSNLNLKLKKIKKIKNEYIVQYLNKKSLLYSISPYKSYVN